MIEYEYGEAQYAGDRDYQEDDCLFLPIKPPLSQNNDIADGEGEAASAMLAVLADGMGGHVGGRIASQTACQTFVDTFLNGGQQSTATKTKQNRLKTALRASNTAIASKILIEADLKGMGCTLVGLRFGQKGMQWISVGDSPLYLFRSGKIEQKNKDHSLAPDLEELVKLGKLSREDADHHPQRHALKSAVMGAKIQLVDDNYTQEVLPLKRGDWVILASDGLQTLSENEIASVIVQNNGAGAQSVANELIAAVKAKRQPYQDNTTVMAINVRASDKSTGRMLPREQLSVRRPSDSISLISRPVVIGGVLAGVAVLLLLAVLGGLFSRPPISTAEDGPGKSKDAASGTLSTDDQTGAGKPISIPAKIAGGDEAPTGDTLSAGPALPQRRNSSGTNGSKSTSVGGKGTKDNVKAQPKKRNDRSSKKSKKVIKVLKRLQNRKKQN